MVASKAYVLGGGVSGLVSAYELLKRGTLVEIFEKENDVGGLAACTKWGGTILDQGPHIYHSPDPDMINYLKKEFGDVLFEKDHFAANLKSGKYYPYPISQEFIDDLDEVTKTKIKSELEFIEKTKKQDKTKNEGKTFDDYVRSIAGDTLTKLFFTDYPRKLWGLSTRELDANWAPKRVQILKKKRAFYGDQYSAVGLNGSYSVINSLKEKIMELGGRIHTKCEVRNIIYDGSQIKKIQLTNRCLDIKSNEVVVNTLSASINSKILKFKTNLHYRGVHIVYVKVSNVEALPKQFDFIYVDDSNILFNRVSDQNRFVANPSTNETVLCCEITYTKNDEHDRTDSSEIEKTVCGQLVELGLLKDAEILDSKSLKLCSVYPMFYLNYRRDLSKYLNFMNSFSNMYLIGSLAEYAYSDLQILMAKGRDLATLIHSETLSRNQLVKSGGVDYLDKTFTVGEFEIGKKGTAFIIAEIGLNHNGSIELAKQLVDSAVQAGCDAVKLQSYKSKKRVSPESRFNRYLERVLDTEETDFEMFKRYELTKLQTEEIFNYAKSKGILIFSAAFDEESLSELLELQVDMIKVASFDLRNFSLLKEIAKSQKPTLLSTGMANLSNIEQAVSIFKDAGSSKVGIFQCTSVYPCPPEAINLNVMETLRRSFGCPVGLSDHSSGQHISLAAVAMGATIIEKHITLDHNLEGPDHALSLTPQQLCEFCNNVREVNAAKGTSVKRPTELEKITALRFIKSMHAIKDIEIGEPLSKEHFEYVAPSWGVLEVDEKVVMGRKVARRISKGEPITLEHFNVS